MVPTAALAPSLSAQGMDGRLEIRVLDTSRQGVNAQIKLAGRSTEFRAMTNANAEGLAILRRIPYGIYQLTVRYAGFEAFERRVKVRSAVPQVIEVFLEVGIVKEEMLVQSVEPFFDPYQPSRAMRTGRERLDETLGTTLGRSTIDVVTAMPGWLLEANAVLHPRGSEYDTQYVIDGMPLYDKRAIAFAPAFENSEFEAVSILTAGLPAEYGRRLGGVIALDSRRNDVPGHRFNANFQWGSFGTRAGAFSHQYAAERYAVSLGVQGGATDRYLDPPALENFTNKGSSGGANARLERDLSTYDRLTVYARSNRTGFLVPNDLAQQKTGQRQDQTSAESAGQFHYQSAISAQTLGSIRAMVRDLTSKLWSNDLATPVHVQQDRGFLESAFMGDLTFDQERHTLKLGGDLRFNSIREQFLLAEPEELPDFAVQFRGRRRSTEVSLFVQNQFRIGNFGGNLGVRFDHYRFLLVDNAASPRIALSYYVPRMRLQVYASYDRIFQPPPTENLLLSSSAPSLDLENVEGALSKPVPASRAHFFEIGFRKPVGDALSLDLKHYWRTFRNYIDDDVFLNTGLSFPITFNTAQIEGTEVRLEVPRWRGISFFMSFSNMLGHASSPVTGGLFLQGDEVEELRDVGEQFPITQDQRNTVAAQVRFELHPRIWASAGARYGSGLPIELENDDEETPQQPIPQAILNEVNFERGRVRPNFSLDLSLGARVWKKDARSVTLQFDVRNATGRFNVINFTALFSGTALAPGRQATVQFRFEF